MAQTRTVRRRANPNRNLWDKIWKDRTGHVVIFQWPNAWLIGWVVLTMISFFANGIAADIWSYLSEISLVVWAFFEIWKGVNYFRKSLGIIVLLIMLAGLFKVGY